MPFDLKDNNICHIISFKGWTPLMGPPEGKCMDIDTVSQNRLNAIQKIMKFDINSNKRF